MRRKIIVLCIACIIIIGSFLLLKKLYLQTYELKVWELTDFSDELVSKVQEEFLFTLPENASIEYIKLAEGKELVVSCCITGDFSFDDFISEKVRFNVDYPYSYMEGMETYRISGFDTTYAIVGLITEEPQTKVIIAKKGIEKGNLFNKKNLKRIK